MNKRYLVFMVVTGSMATLSFFACDSKPKSSTESGVQSAKQAPQADTYTCPMHPQIRKSEPGQCPICGMNLVKVESQQKGHEEHDAHGVNEGTKADEAKQPTGHAPVHLDAVRSQMIGVKLGKVERKPLFKNIRAAGRLAYDPELYTAQNEYVEALKQFESVKNSPVADVRQSAKKMVDSAKLRLKILGLSDQQIANITRSDRSDSSLLLNKAGQSAWVYADIYEMDLPHIRPGLSAEISAGFLGGKTLSGKVVSVDRVISPATRTAKARILISEARSLLRPESYVDVSIRSPLGEQITVPYDAILDTGKEAWVFVADGKGNYTPRVVEIKFNAGSEVAISSGLKEGEQIVTSANFLIDSESRLRGVMAAPSDHAAHGAHGTP
ncbi:MAG: hypothetical protein A2428_05350 [Bdellovibrionales bacterium RIFOXYC1_FULL_54_43]|nr:MAG: hypothetical protein A2428_05350 [Bdellovibrionales bacterium RIFOXYC1_FULL_54_43]